MTPEERKAAWARYSVASRIFALPVEVIAALGDIPAALDALDAKDEWRKNVYATFNEIEQVLGRALGYPEYGPDGPGNPGEVCVGDHVPQSIADEAARKLDAKDREIAILRAMLDGAHS